MCDSRSLRRGSSRPLRPNSAGDRSSRLVDRDDHLQVSRVVGQAFQRLLGALETDQRLVVALLVLGDPPEFHQSPRIRLVDIRVVGAAPSPLQQAPGCP